MYTLARFHEYMITYTQDTRNIHICIHMFIFVYIYQYAVDTPRVLAGEKQRIGFRRNYMSLLS
jgi:hypothetical protein